MERGREGGGADSEMRDGGGVVGVALITLMREVDAALETLWIALEKVG